MTFFKAMLDFFSRSRNARLSAFFTLLALIGCVTPLLSLRAEPTPSHNLVSLDVVQPPVLPEIRYATRHNFTGEAVYSIPRLWLHKDAACALSRVQHELQKSGLGLKVYDAYRPLSVQQKMWDLIRDERYVSNPAKNKGRHTRGTAVDVTLIDKKGRELPMPSDYDDFTERANRKYQGATSEEKHNRQLLEDVMVRHGFLPFPDEWWHFDLKGWEKYPVFDIPLKSLVRSR